MPRNEDKREHFEGQYIPPQPYPGQIRMGIDPAYIPRPLQSRELGPATANVSVEDMSNVRVLRVGCRNYRVKKLGSEVELIDETLGGGATTNRAQLIEVLRALADWLAQG